MARTTHQRVVRYRRDHGKYNTSQQHSTAPLIRVLSYPINLDFRLILRQSKHDNLSSEACNVQRLTFNPERHRPYHRILSIRLSFSRVRRAQLPTFRIQTRSFNLGQTIMIIPPLHSKANSCLLPSALRLSHGSTWSQDKISCRGIHVS